MENFEKDIWIILPVISYLVASQWRFTHHHSSVICSADIQFEDVASVQSFHRRRNGPHVQHDHGWDPTSGFLRWACLYQWAEQNVDILHHLGGIQQSIIIIYLSSLFSPEEQTMVHYRRVQLEFLTFLLPPRSNKLWRTEKKKYWVCSVS